MDSSDHHTQHAAGEASVGELVQQASQQLSDLVRDEMRLAQAEMTRKSKRFGLGGGMFGGAGLFGFLTLQALVATAIAAVALTLPVWAAGLIISGALLVVAALMAATGKKQIGKATPPAPEPTIDSVKADMTKIKERAHR